MSVKTGSWVKLVYGVMPFQIRKGQGKISVGQYGLVFILWTLDIHGTVFVPSHIIRLYHKEDAT